MSAATTLDLSPLWNIVGRLLETGRWHDAEVTLRSAAETTGSLPVRVTLGSLLAERGAVRAAIDEWTLALAAATEAGDFDTLSAVYHNLAAVYREQGDCALAARLQQQSLHYLSDGDASDFLQLANDALFQQKWDLAECLLETADDLDRAEAKEDQADSLCVEIAATKGILAGFRGVPREGWRMLARACRQHEQRGAYRLAVKDLVNLAALLSQMGRHRLTISCLKRAQFHAACVDDAILQERVSRLLNRTQHERVRNRFQAEWN